MSRFPSKCGGCSARQKTLRSGEHLIASLTGGKRWGDGVEKYCIRSDGYPGMEALLARAA